jgi:alkyl hydroperoxide reductase subunit AhpF
MDRDGAPSVQSIVRRGPVNATASATLIRTALADLPAPVTLVSYTPDVESWYSRAERELLERIAAASDRITLRILAERWDAAREHGAGIQRTPCLAVVGEVDAGIHYYGLPDGYELETFLGVIRAVAEQRSGLAPRTIERLRALESPVHLEVCVSPT